MTDSPAFAPEPDDRAFQQVVPVPPEIRRTSPGWAGRLMVGWVCASLLLAVVCLVCLATGIGQLDFSPLHIVVHGDGPPGAVSISGLDETSRNLLAVAGLAAAVLLVLVLPMLLLLVFGALAIALVAGVGLPLIVVATAIAVVTSPLWVVALVVWQVTRRKASTPRAPASATIAA